MKHSSRFWTWASKVTFCSGVALVRQHSREGQLPETPTTAEPNPIMAALEGAGGLRYTAQVSPCRVSGGFSDTNTGVQRLNFDLSDELFELIDRTGVAIYRQEFLGDVRIITINGADFGHRTSANVDGDGFAQSGHLWFLGNRRTFNASDLKALAQAAPGLEQGISAEAHFDSEVRNFLTNESSAGAALDLSAQLGSRGVTGDAYPCSAPLHLLASRVFSEVGALEWQVKARERVQLALIGAVDGAVDVLSEEDKFRSNMSANVSLENQTLTEIDSHDRFLPKEEQEAARIDQCIAGNDVVWPPPEIEVTSSVNATFEQSANTSESELQSKERCVKPYARCANECFGMCGRGCSCYKFVCGNCHCQAGCEVHDKHCSCEGFMSIGCWTFQFGGPACGPCKGPKAFPDPREDTHEIRGRKIENIIQAEAANSFAQ